MVKYILIYLGISFISSIITILIAKRLFTEPVKKEKHKEPERRIPCETCKRLKMYYCDRWYCESLPGGCSYNAPKICGNYIPKEQKSMDLTYKKPEVYPKEDCLLAAEAVRLYAKYVDAVKLDIR